MPVYIYKTFDAVERALWNFYPNEAFFNKVAELWNFANKLSPITYPRGVFKYRSIEEANKQREDWELTYTIEKQLKRRTNSE